MKELFKKKNCVKRANRGFTLVELIVVLIILAILAAILVPALMGYIDKAKSESVLITGRAYKDAAQAMFTELYGKQGDVPAGTPVVSGAIRSSASEPSSTYKKGNGDQDITNTGFAKRLLQLVDTEDNDPYFFMVAVGSNAVKGNAGNINNTVHDKYTVYYAFYKETADSPNWFYYNGEWTKTNPRATGTVVLNDYNVITSGPLKGKRLQYYIISNHNSKYPESINSSGFWDWIKKQE